MNIDIKMQKKETVIFDEKKEDIVNMKKMIDGIKYVKNVKYGPNYEAKNIVMFKKLLQTYKKDNFYITYDMGDTKLTSRYMLNIKLHTELEANLLVSKDIGIKMVCFSKNLKHIQKLTYPYGYECSIDENNLMSLCNEYDNIYFVHPKLLDFYK